MDFNERKRSVIIRWRRILNRLGMRSKKIFAIGYNKSGTSSLDSLFLDLARPSYHGIEWRSCSDMKILGEYDCFSDGIPEDLPKLDQTFPGSKYILQLRDLDSWIYSRLGHISKEKKKGIHPGSDYWDDTDSAVTLWITQRNEYHLKVLEYFSGRPEDLIVVNFIRDQDAATKICQFLGYEGSYERPHKNINPAKVPPIEYTERLQRCAQKLGIPNEELAYDIYAPSLVTDRNQLGYPKDSRELT